jgi:hypothetical protein
MNPSFIAKFKTGIRFVVSIFASREFGFVYCLIGTLAQIAHTYFLVTNISSLTGGWKTAQAMAISVFISSSLLFFTAIASNDDSKDSRRIHLAVNLFMVIEILINFYYYSRHLLLDNANVQIYDFVFGVLVACLIPVTIKLYAGLIQAKEWLEEFSGKSNESVPEKELQSLIEKTVSEQLSHIVLPEQEYVSDEHIREIAKQLFTNVQDEIDERVAKSFQQNSEIFLRQFENKLRYIIDKKAKE